MDFLPDAGIGRGDIRHLVRMGTCTLLAARDIGARSFAEPVLSAVEGLRVTLEAAEGRRCNRELQHEREPGPEILGARPPGAPRAWERVVCSRSGIGQRGLVGAVKEETAPGRPERRGGRRARSSVGLPLPATGRGQPGAAWVTCGRLRGGVPWRPWGV